MPAGASLEALTVSAHSCSKAQCSLKLKRAEKRLAGKLDAKDSWFAACFLSLYLAVYLAAGLVGVAAIEWIWTKLFA